MYLVVVEQNTTQIQNNNFASKIFANKWQRMKRFQFMIILLANTKDLNEL